MLTFPIFKHRYVAVHYRTCLIVSYSEKTQHDDICAGVMCYIASLYVTVVTKMTDVMDERTMHAYTRTPRSILILVCYIEGQQKLTLTTDTF